jgi:hypothetical protein
VLRKSQCAKESGVFFLFVDTSVFLRLVFCIDIRAVICVFYKIGLFYQKMIWCALMIFILSCFLRNLRNWVIVD